MTDEEFEAALSGMPIQTIEVVRVPGWEPKAACCHENVDAWVKANPGSKSIRGWLIQGGCDPIFLIAAHSIVQGTVAICVGIDFGAISSMTRLPDHAARSIV